MKSVLSSYVTCQTYLDNRLVVDLEVVADILLNCGGVVELILSKLHRDPAGCVQNLSPQLEDSFSGVGVYVIAARPQPSPPRLDRDWLTKAYDVGGIQSFQKYDYEKKPNKQIVVSNAVLSIN